MAADKMNLQRFGGEALKVGGTAVGSALIVSALLRRTGWSYGTRAAVAATSQVVAGVIVSQYAPNVGIGLVTAGLVTGAQLAAVEINTRRMLAAAESRQNLPQTGTQTTQQRLEAGSVPTMGSDLPGTYARERLRAA